MLGKLAKNHTVDWRPIVLLIALLTAVVVLLLLGDSSVKVAVIEWGGWIGLGLSQFMGPIIKRKLQRQSNDKRQSNDNE